MLDSWLDLVHGACCVGCGVPGRVLCQGCHGTLPVTSASTRPDPCPPGLRPCRATGEYAGLLRGMVLAHKEHRIFGLAAPLGELLALAAAPMLGPTTWLVPVPTRRAMVRERGHDSTLRMVRAATGLLRASGHDVTAQAALAHRLPVADQAGLTAMARAKNRADTMVLKPSHRALLSRASLRPTVLICDDVLTTGATAREAQRALTDAGVDVAGIACVAATRRRLPTGASRESLPFSPVTY